MSALPGIYALVRGQKVLMVQVICITRSSSIAKLRSIAKWGNITKWSGYWLQNQEVVGSIPTLVLSLFP